MDVLFSRFKECVCVCVCERVCVHACVRACSMVPTIARRLFGSSLAPTGRCLSWPDDFSAPVCCRPRINIHHLFCEEESRS